MKTVTQERKARRFVVDPADLDPPGPSVILKGGEDVKRRRAQLRP